MTRTFNIGDKVRLSPDAIDNYGPEYTGVYEVEQWYDHYASPKTMASDTHGHPGFDNAGDCLYHLRGLNFDLYAWELQEVL